MLILLADDERLVRLGLQSMLEELFPCQHTYLHARNGKEVVDLLKKQSPDIAFLDVKMPFLSGLEALQTCREMSVSTVWIILSGYADFEYARQAVSLSAFDYILKPIELDTLKKLFERIVIRREQDRQHSNTIFSHDITRSFNMADQFSPEETEFLPAAPSDYIFYQFYIDFPDSAMQKKVKQKLCDSLKKFCTEHVSILNYCLFFNTAGNLCLVCDAPDATFLTRFISLQSEGLPPNAFSVFWGNNKSIRNIYEISQRISRIADIRLIRNFSEPAFIKNVEALPSLSTLLAFTQTLTSFLDMYLSHDRDSCRLILARLKTTDEFSRIFPLVDLPVLQNYLSVFFGRSICVRTYQELTGLLEQAEISMNTAVFTASVADAEQIRAFVYKNYAGDVSISRASEVFGLSPTYLSRLFHEKTGQKYIDFVTRVRMEEAKKILAANPSVSVREAAESVGYCSVRHFSKTFQKYTGVLPSNFGSADT